MSSDFREPNEIIRRALVEFPDILMTTGLNLAGTVLLDLAWNQGFRGEVVLVDTGFHFPETLEFWEYLSDRYGEIEFVKLWPSVETGNLFETDPVACCRANKVAPLEDYLQKRKPKARLNARTRESATGRVELPVIEIGDPTNVNPLVKLMRVDLEGYASEKRLRLHPLYAQGFLSMGCWPCTKAVRPGEDPRSGRFVGQGRTECGLWGTLGEGKDSVAVGLSATKNSKNYERAGETR